MRDITDTLLGYTKKYCSECQDWFPIEEKHTCHLRDFRILKQRLINKVEDMSESEIRETLNQRGTRYGEFPANAQKAQFLKKMWRASDGYKTLETYPQETQDTINEAMENILAKIARAMNGDPTYDDNFVDFKGYSQLVLDYLRQLKDAPRIKELCKPPSTDKDSL